MPEAFHHEESVGPRADSPVLSEAFLKAILETAVDAIAIIDGKGTVHAFNRSAVRMFGYETGEVLGRNISMLMPPAIRREHDAYLARYLRTGEAHIIGSGREVSGLRKNGELFPVDLAVSEVRDGDRCFFVGIMRDISEQRLLEKALVEAGENERREIGRDLHDALGQVMTGISLLATSLARKLAARDGALAADAETLAAMSVEAMTEAKRLAHGAYPTELERHGLSATLKQMLDDVQQRHNVETSFEEDATWPSLEQAIELHLYRIAQESIANAIRHGHPQRLDAALERDGDTLVLCIRDDGTGMQPKAEPRRLSMGLDSMRRRAALIGGTLSIRTSREGGTEVQCCFPLPLHVPPSPTMEAPPHA